MKNIGPILLTFLLATALLPAAAQFQGTNEGSVATYSAAGCLSCPGSEWNNPAEALTFNYIYSEAHLEAAGACFQTACYYSRGLMLSDFGFTIPVNATITSIRVHVTRNSSVTNAIRDTIRIMVGGQPTGLPLTTGYFWPFSNSTVTIGDSVQALGLALTPAMVNDPDFGVWLQAVNHDSVPAQARVDMIRLSLYYTVPTAVCCGAEPQVPIQVYYLAQAHALQIDTSHEVEKRQLLVVSDSRGDKVFESDVRTGPHMQVQLPPLAAGIYFYTLYDGAVGARGRFVEVR